MRKLLFIFIMSIGYSQYSSLIIGDIELSLGEDMESAWYKIIKAEYVTLNREGTPIFDIEEKNKLNNKNNKIGFVSINRNKKIDGLGRTFERELKDGNRRTLVDVMYFALSQFEHSKIKIDFESVQSEDPFKIIMFSDTWNGTEKSVSISNMIMLGTKVYDRHNFVSVVDMILKE